MQITCSIHAQAKSARDFRHGLSDSSRPSKLGRIPCRFAVLRTKVSLCLSLIHIAGWTGGRAAVPGMTIGFPALLFLMAYKTFSTVLSDTLH